MNEKSEHFLDRLTERLPVFDGSFKRRFIAGLTFFGIVLLDTRILHYDPEKIADIVDKASVPIVLLAIALLIYSVGVLVELVLDLFLIGDQADLARWYLYEKFFSSSADRRWAQGLVESAREACLIGTAVIMALFTWLFQSTLLDPLLSTDRLFEDEAPLAELRAELKDVKRRTANWNESLQEIKKAEEEYTATLTNLIGQEIKESGSYFSHASARFGAKEFFDFPEVRTSVLSL